MYCYYSKVNYYENYHMMIRVLENFDVNLKRLSWNSFGSPSASQTH